MQDKIYVFHYRHLIILIIQKKRTKKLSNNIILINFFIFNEMLFNLLRKTSPIILIINKLFITFL